MSDAGAPRLSGARFEHPLDVRYLDRETPMLIALLQAVASGLAVGGAYALIALGFSITFTTTKTLNFSHGDFVSVGSFEIGRAHV